MPGIEVAATIQKVEAKSSDGLPDDYQPVPKEQWISIHPQKAGGRPQVSLTNATSESADVPGTTRHEASPPYSRDAK